jgi:hypothetical protein
MMNKGIQNKYMLAKYSNTPKVLANLCLIFSYLSLLESPTPATREDSSSEMMGSFLFVPPEVLLNRDFARNNEFTLEVRYVLFLVSTTIPSGNGYTPINWTAS